MNAARDILVADVLVGNDGSISAIDPSIPATAATRTIDARGQLLIPGLVQAHLHLCQTLFRGLSEQRVLLIWLRERIWPLEAAHTPASLRASADLGIAELLRSGTTAVLDMGTVNHTDALFESAVESGIRYVGGHALMDSGDGVPAGLRQSTADALAESDRLCAAWDGAADGRIGYAYTPRFILSCSEPLLRGVAERATSSSRVHTHASEQREELDEVHAIVGCTDVEYFAKIGMLGSKTVLAHCVWLDTATTTLIQASGASVTHCPASNLKIASGLAPVRGMLDHGVNVALGADGAACSNRLDAWSQMWLAGLVGAVRDGPTALGAREVFEMATLGGARALGMVEQIGSIEVGKRADLVLVDASTLEPNGSVYDTLVFSAGPSNVTHVIVDGRPVVDAGELTTLDPERVRRVARAERDALVRRAGL
jgi:cytosine/adenosine deaminase-related metal-dependent hydrolase